MIRVLHAIDTTGPGGAETVFVSLAAGLDPEQFQSFAVIRGSGWVCDALRKNGIEPLFVQSRGSFNRKYLYELIKIIRKYRIDIIQSHLLGTNLYCSLAGMLCRVPVISTFHGFVDASANERFMKMKTWIINRGSKKIVFVSDRLREGYIRKYGFSAAKSVTIYNGVDTGVFKPQKDDSIRQRLGLGPDHILIGALGNIRPAKGYDLFLRAARRIYDKHPEARCVVAGQGSGELYRNLLELRKALELEDVFFFIGFCEDAVRVLNNLDIFVLPSTTEGFSISTIEAMACGLPVVVTRSGGPEEIVIDGENGVAVDCSEGAIARGLIELIEDEELKKAISLRAYSLVQEKFSSAAMIKSYSHVNEKIRVTCKMKVHQFFVNSFWRRS
ncbi:MAG: glycosyltransferase family 4 protein [Desulfobacteraceae bacterium]|nr:glycosyltransferase family 4 protein [Desulfobacteraceae bacterium]MCF8112079.1 glycosyltransferase family 4 protein [Desulfobacteraceae bacterium]